MPSTPGAPSMKWTGASTCVPLWTPKSSRETLQTAPSAIAIGRSMRTTGSPGNEIIPGRIGTLMSIHTIAIQVLP